MKLVILLIFGFLGIAHPASASTPTYPTNLIIKSATPITPESANHSKALVLTSLQLTIKSVTINESLIAPPNTDYIDPIDEIYIVVSTVKKNYTTASIHSPITFTYLHNGVGRFNLVTPTWRELFILRNGTVDLQLEFFRSRATTRLGLFKENVQHYFNRKVPTELLKQFSSGVVDFSDYLPLQYVTNEQNHGKQIGEADVKVLMGFGRQ